MTDHNIDNNYRLDAHCKDIAESIAQELGDDWCLDDAISLAPSYVESDANVIYHYRALGIVMNCSLDYGRDAIESMDYQTSDIFELATMLVHYEMEGRVVFHICELDDARK